MKASRFSDAQKAFVLRQAEEGLPIGEVCRKVGISQATFYSWRKKYAGLLPTEMRRLKALEDENARLKKLVAELSLDKEMLQDVVRRKTLRPVRQRQLVEAVQVDWNVSQRRACATLDVNRSTCQYRSRRPGQAPLEARIKEICETRVRYGYRRVHVQLRREGWGMNHKKVHRVYNELGLQLRNKRPKRRVKARLREDRSVAIAANEMKPGRWTSSTIGSPPAASCGC